MHVYVHQYIQNPAAAQRCARISSDLMSRQHCAGDSELQFFPLLNKKTLCTA